MCTLSPAPCAAAHSFITLGHSVREERGGGGGRGRRRCGAGNKGDGGVMGGGDCELKAYRGMCKIVSLVGGLSREKTEKTRIFFAILIPCLLF